MDVDDLLTIARFILDYIGVDVDDWNFNWRRWRSNIRHRNLVRLMGTYLCETKVKRIHFQHQMIGRETEEMDSVFYISSDSVIDEHTSRLWVEDDLGNGIIQIRPHQGEPALLGNCTEENGMLRHQPARTSTPLGDQTNMSKLSQDRDAKIFALEDELTKLREQIAFIVVSQEQGSLLLPIQDTTATDHSKLMNPSQSTVSQPDIVKSVPPPPPPPLPPLITVDSEHSVCMAPSDDVKEQEKLPAPVLMTDVLRDIKNVKLKKAVERSPGGTPLRKNPPALKAHDPATLIALALKKKFAHRRVALASPADDKENSSPDCSPHTPTGVKRKSILRRSSANNFLGPKQETMSPLATESHVH